MNDQVILIMNDTVHLPVMDDDSDVKCLAGSVSEWVLCFLGTRKKREKKKAVGTSRGVRHTFLRAAQILIFLIFTLYVVYSYNEFFEFKLRFIVLILVQSY